jgi:Gpi18-like mannosyltransferase
VTRVVFGTVAYAAAWLLASSTGPRSPGALELWRRWDALHFFAIARSGYARAGPHDTAFFPGFPLAVRALSAVGFSELTAGLVVSALASLVAFAFLFKLAEEDVGQDAGRRAVTYLAFFPTAVFLVAPYSEALFLAGAVPAFYFARRGRWGVAGVAAAVAVAARFAGVFLVAGLAAEWFVRRRERAERRGAVLGLAVALTPLVAYMLFLRRLTGDPLRFVTDQRLGWGRELTHPVTDRKSVV